MAETLGSLVDKLTIKALRQYHLKESIMQKNKKFSLVELRQKLSLVEKQKMPLIREIEEFIILVAQGKKILRDEKIKLYNPKETIGRIPALTSVATAISHLAEKNAQLWHLEDEARRKDKGLAYVGSIKRKIDLANQQRNDLIDKIDELFEDTIKKTKKKTR